ncbi:MAG: hypothetical protein EHM57_07505, partial [Actinobacteria bacterium]
MEPVELRLAFAIARRFEEYRRRFDSITLRARARFEGRAWRALQHDIGERIDAYEVTLDEALGDVVRLHAERADDRRLWSEGRELYRRLIVSRPDAEIAATYFNSVTRRLFDTGGVDEQIEFVAREVAGAAAGAESWLREEDLPEDPEELIDTLLRDRRFHATWRDRHGDVIAGGAALAVALRSAEISSGRVEVLIPTFYRGRGAYV